MAGVSIPYRPSHFVENRTGEEIIISHARPGDLVFLKDVTESVVTVRCCVAKVICEQCRNIRVVLTRTPVCQMVELIRCSGLVLRIGEYVGLQTFQVDLSHDCILEVLRPFFEGKIYCTDSPGTEIRLREAGEGGLTQHMVERPNNTAAGTQFVSRFQDGMLVSSVVQREGVGGYIVQDVL